MARLHSARYGDRVQVAGDPDSPIRHTVGVMDLPRLIEPELEALERFTDARLAAKDT
jgi:hypothetical protein